MTAVTIPRYLNVRDILKNRSCFLFGPRQTGKSTLISQQLAGCPNYNLLDQSLFIRLSLSGAPAESITLRFFLRTIPR